MKREYKASIWMKLWIKRIAGKKNILLLMLLFLILTIYLEPLKSFVSISGYKISPWVYPFLITDSNFLIIFMCGVICFFSNTIFFKAKDCYYFLRMGRKKWIVMESGYVILSAVMISVLNIIMTWGVLNIQMHFENSLGKVLYTLAKTNAGEQCGLFWNISAQYISEHSVMESMIISMIITIFGITFLGIFLLCCSLFFNRVISIALSSILVVTSSLVVNLGDLMQKKLATISPIAWMRVADLDVNRFGVEISPSLSFIIWGYLILIGGLVGIICRRANNIDLIWEEYE